MCIRDRNSNKDDQWPKESSKEGDLFGMQQEGQQNFSDDFDAKMFDDNSVFYQELDKYISSYLIRKDEEELFQTSLKPRRRNSDHTFCKKEDTHFHGERCGHLVVYHNGHIDYIVDGRLHHPHEGHCDDHGPISIVKKIEINSKNCNNSLVKC
eukprot:TRINITY_DN7076_c0_g1_i5.p1 TRINITY_DN7076_c0_g1~~TRINITY_DN7076_c0_g1_i5.p1  ORF type:complete len:153 (+),score=16.97 TRINITY_DN7076_c0_g1_i5:103-561(+)